MSNTSEFCSYLKTYQLLILLLRWSKFLDNYGQLQRNTNDQDTHGFSRYKVRNNGILRTTKIYKIQIHAIYSLFQIVDSWHFSSLQITNIYYLLNNLWWWKYLRLPFSFFFQSRILLTEHLSLGFSQRDWALWISNGFRYNHERIASMIIDFRIFLWVIS